MTKPSSFLAAAARACAPALLALQLWTAGGVAAAEEGGPVDPRAVERLRSMSETLTKARTLSLEAETLYDQVELSGVKIKRTVSHEVVLERPGSLYFESRRDDGKVREGRYDGKALTIVPAGGGSYARIEAPGTNDDMLDVIQTDYNLQLPVVDLLYSDLYGRLKDHVLSAVDLGARTIGGEVLDHLSFETTGADLQLWLERGDRPLPRRMVLTLVSAPGQPEYLTVIRRWQLDGPVDGGMFRFEPPADWRRIEVAKLPRHGGAQ